MHFFWPTWQSPPQLENTGNLLHPPPPPLTLLPTIQEAASLLMQLDLQVQHCHSLINSNSSLYSETKLLICIKEKKSLANLCILYLHNMYSQSLILKQHFYVIQNYWSIYVWHLKKIFFVLSFTQETGSVNTAAAASAQTRQEAAWSLVIGSIRSCAPSLPCSRGVTCTSFLTVLSQLKFSCL